MASPGKKKDGNDITVAADDDGIDVSKRVGFCQSLCTPCMMDCNDHAIGALLT